MNVYFAWSATQQADLAIRIFRVGPLKVVRRRPNGILKGARAPYWKGGDEPMQQYEIRILHRNSRPTVVQSRFLGDFHAIRRGQAMAHPDEGVEVWRGMKCLYRREYLPQDFDRGPNTWSEPAPSVGLSNRGGDRGTSGAPA